MRLIDDADVRRRIIAFATGLHSAELPVDTVMMLLTQVPTIDAVPVVRCGQCRYERPEVDAYTQETVGYWCSYHDIGSVQDSDFCSYGERKEGAD